LRAFGKFCGLQGETDAKAEHDRATKRKREKDVFPALSAAAFVSQGQHFHCRKSWWQSCWDGRGLKVPSGSLALFLRQDKWVSYPAAKLMPRAHTEKQKYKFSARFPLSLDARLFFLSLVFAAIFNVFPLLPRINLHTTECRGFRACMRGRSG